MVKIPNKSCTQGFPTSCVLGETCSSSEYKQSYEWSSLYSLYIDMRDNSDEILSRERDESMLYYKQVNNTICKTRSFPCLPACAHGLGTKLETKKETQSCCSVQTTHMAGSRHDSPSTKKPSPSSSSFPAHPHALHYYTPTTSSNTTVEYLNHCGFSYVYICLAS